jgi:hypothetical protein
MEPDETPATPYTVPNIYVSNSSGQLLTMALPDEALSYTLVFPAVNSGGFLQNDGAGTLRWRYDTSSFDVIDCNGLNSLGSIITIYKPLILGSNSISAATAIVDQITSSGSSIVVSKPLTMGSNLLTATNLLAGTIDAATSITVSKPLSMGSNILTATNLLAGTIDAATSIIVSKPLSMGSNMLTATNLFTNTIDATSSITVSKPLSMGSNMLTATNLLAGTIDAATSITVSKPLSMGSNMLTATNLFTNTIDATTSITVSKPLSMGSNALTATNIILDQITGPGTNITFNKPIALGSNSLTANSLISSQHTSASTMNFSGIDNTPTTFSAYFSPRLNNTRQTGDITSLILAGSSYGLTATEGTKLEISHGTSVTTKIGTTDIINVTSTAITASTEIQSAQDNAIRLTSNNGQIRLGNLSGTVGTGLLPAIAFSGTTNTFDTGIYTSSNATLAFSCSNSTRLTINTSLTNTPNAFRVSTVGSAALPSVQVNSSNMGFYQVAANQLGISTSGVLRCDINTTRINMALPVYLPNGTVTAPSLTFASDTSQNSGLYLIANDNIGFAINGSLLAAFSSTGVTVNGQVGVSTLRVSNRLVQWMDFGQTTSVNINAGASGTLSVLFSVSPPDVTGIVVNTNTSGGTGFGGIVCNASLFTTSGFTIYYYNPTASNATSVTFQWSAII